MEHTLKDCNNAKKELIKKGLYEDADFYLNDPNDLFGAEIYLNEEPMIKTKDGSLKSALETYNDFMDSEEEGNNNEFLKD